MKVQDKLKSEPWLRGAATDGVREALREKPRGMTSVAVQKAEKGGVDDLHSEFGCGRFGVRTRRGLGSDEDTRPR